jgi:hypothetical protein
LDALRIFLCSDSSQKRWGTARFRECDGRAVPREEWGEDWNDVFAAYHIYVKEAMAAVLAIERFFDRNQNLTGANIIIGVDNSAAAAALRRGFSSNKIVNDGFRRLYQLLRARKCILTVLGLPGVVNASDPASRGERLAKWKAPRDHPLFVPGGDPAETDGERLTRHCWAAMSAALGGRKYHITGKAWEAEKARRNQVRHDAADDDVEEPRECLEAAWIDEMYLEEAETRDAVTQE